MSYVANTEIDERLGHDTYLQLTDDDGDGVADVAVVDEARLGGEGEVNSYLANRYAVPVDLVANANVAGVIKSVTLDLIEYRLRLRRPPVPAAALTQYANAIAWLARLSRGEIELPAVGIARTATRGEIAQSTGEERLLSRDELSDY